MHYKLPLFVLMLLLLCPYNTPANKQGKYIGVVDLSRYVAIGNSLTSGYMDGELSRDGQLMSFPNLLSQQFEQVQSGNFKQPLMADNSGFGKRIVFNLLKRQPEFANDSINQKNLENIASLGPFNNMGVPGITVGDLTSLTIENQKAANYFRRFAKNYGSQSILSQALEQKPTFVTLWIGSNDVLGYASHGGDMRDYPNENITDLTSFRKQFKAVIDSIGDTPGLVGNIPGLDGVPFFDIRDILSTYYDFDPYHGLMLTQQQADSANLIIKEAEQITAHDYNFRFKAGGNPILVEDPNLNLPQPYNFRPIQHEDLINLYFLGLFDQLKMEVNERGFGWINAEEIRPIPHRYIIDKSERRRIDMAIAGFNHIISDILEEAPNLHLVDMASEIKQLKNGLILDSELTQLQITSDYILGGFYSMDGIHPSQDGNVLIANAFIRAFNLHFQANIPLLRPRLLANLGWWTNLL